MGLFGKGQQGYRVYSPEGLSTSLTRRGGGLGAETGLYDVGGLFAQDPNKPNRTLQIGGTHSKTKKHCYDLVKVGRLNKGQTGIVYGPDGLSPTICAAPGKGARANAGNHLIEGRVRRLTPRECFRLHGFSDDFKLPCSDSQLYKQAGNAVSPPVITAIARGFNG